jgi:hypothetical protein
MGIFNDIGKLLGGAFSKSRSGFDDAIDISLFDIEYEKLNTMCLSVTPFAKKADDSYLALKYNKLNQVPAIELYDGNYIERLNEITAKANTLNPESKTSLLRLEKYEDELTKIATQIQTYLNEPTSTLEEAKLWDSKFVKGVKDHIPPHDKKGENIDDTMSLVMEAFRNWASFAQASIDLYGSQRLINATYEAAEEGIDPMEYMTEILDLNTRENSMFGGDLHENVIVPYAGFFGGGFFF